MSKGVQCPECGGIRGRAVNSNMDVESNRIRLRKCDDCGHRFSTVEVVLPGLNYHRTRPSKEGVVARRVPQHVKVVPSGKSIRVELVESKLTNVCRRGHPLTEANTYVIRNKRTCLTCRRAAARALYHHSRRKAPPSILEEQRARWREAYRTKRARRAA